MISRVVRRGRRARCRRGPEDCVFIVVDVLAEVPDRTVGDLDELALGVGDEMRHPGFDPLALPLDDPGGGQLVASTEFSPASALNRRT